MTSTRTRWFEHTSCFTAALVVTLICGVGAHADSALSEREELIAAAQTSGEAEALQALALGKFIRARELAEKEAKANSRSFLAHFIVGFALHYAESDLPRALFELKHARELFEAQYGRKPARDAPWRWHSRILLELAEVQGSMELHAEKLRTLDRYNQLYDPDVVAERAWPLMKLRLYDQARRAAKAGLTTDDADQHALALNALCAIEFEAGDDGASYDACKRAVEDSENRGYRSSSVDLTNFAEAARAFFRFDEAEKALLDATDAGVAWHGNPWVELAELYTRQGRFKEALSALREVPGYRARRPPHVREIDRNEARRALAAYLVVIGHPEEAIELTDKALVLPDRRAHNSRDPEQDRALIAFLDREAKLTRAEMKLEEAAAKAWPKRLWARLEAWWLGFQAWRSGRRAVKDLADPKRLVGIFRLGTSTSAILPPWLAGDMTELLGPNVARAAIGAAQQTDGREGARAYYAALAGEALYLSGNYAEAQVSLGNAIDGLPPSEKLLRARTSARRAALRWSLGDAAGALNDLDVVFQSDPGVLRRLRMRVPVEVYAGGVPNCLVAPLLRSPRLETVAKGGFHLDVRASSGQARACLIGPSGSVLGCGEAALKADATCGERARTLADAFHAGAFAPRIDLSQTDIGSLDGSNRTTANPLEEVSPAR